MPILFENILCSNVGCFIIAVASVFTLININRGYTINSKDLTCEVKEWMENDFKNKIIKWKRENPNKKDSFSHFIKDIFPENIKTNGDHVIWIDRRINGESWKGTFGQISTTDKIVKLGKPPGT